MDHERGEGRTKQVPAALATAGGVISGAIAIGCLVSAALIHWLPWSATMTLAVPYGLAILIVVVQVFAAALLMDRVPRARQLQRQSWSSTLRSGAGLALAPALRWLIAAMVMVGIGVTALERFMPIRLDAFAVDTSAAGTAMGLVSATAWGLGSVGALMIGRALERRAAAPVAILLICIEGGAIIAMAAAAGPVALIAGYLGAYLVHSAFSGTFSALVHERVDDAHRGTLLSVVSISFLGAASLAGVVLGHLADVSSSSAALLVGGASFVTAGALIASGTRRGRPAR